MEDILISCNIVCGPRDVMRGRELVYLNVSAVGEDSVGDDYGGSSHRLLVLAATLK